MLRLKTMTLVQGLAITALTCGAVGPVHAGAAETSYPTRAPLEQYRMASGDESPWRGAPRRRLSRVTPRS